MLEAVETPPETMVEEKQDLMISPSGGDPFHKTAHFLKPISPSSIQAPHFDSAPLTKCQLQIQFRVWRLKHQDLQTWVHHLAPTHHSTWKKTGIYDAIFNSTYQIRKQIDLLHGLAEQWCCETNTFIFPWGEATITLEDVMVLGGFPVLGDSILSPLPSREMKETKAKLEKERMRLYEGGAKGATNSLWRKKFIKSGSKLEHVAFLVFWLSRYVFNDSRDSVNKAVFSIAVHLDRGTRVALGPPVLAHIYRDLGLLKRTIIGSDKSDGSHDVLVKSPFHLVQVWAWERFLELSPVLPNTTISYGEPRLARWDRVDGQDFRNLRIVLDSAGEDFIWRPYAIAIDKWKQPGYYLEKEKLVGPGLDDEFLSFALCLRVTDLIGFGTMEQYLPHRVARQFGYDQDIPSFVARADDDSDILSGRGVPHIAWNDHIEEIKKLKLYVPSRLSEADVTTSYMQWWDKIVCINIMEPMVQQKKKAKTTEGSVIHPGFQQTKVADSSKERNRFTGFTIPSVSCSNSSQKAVKILEVQNEGNDSLVPPGFHPIGTMMEAGHPMDEDEPNNPQMSEKGKNKNVESRKGVDVSIADKSSVDILMSERLEKEVMLSPALIWGCKAKRSIKYVIVSNARSSDTDMVRTIGNEWASRVERQVSELKDIVRSFKESDILKYYQRHTNVEIRRGEIQNLASSTGEEGSVISLKSEKFEKEVILSEALNVESRPKINLKGDDMGCNARGPNNHMVSNLGNACASCCSLFEKQVSDLKARVSRLESLADMSQANTTDAGDGNC